MKGITHLLAVLCLTSLLGGARVYSQLQANWTEWCPSQQPTQQLTPLEAEAWRQVQALGNDSHACVLKCELLKELARIRRGLGNSPEEAKVYLCLAHHLGACCQHKQLSREYVRIHRAQLTRECEQAAAGGDPSQLSPECAALLGGLGSGHTQQLHHQRHQFDMIVSVTEWARIFVYHALPYALVTVADALGVPHLRVLGRHEWNTLVCSSVTSNERDAWFLALRGKRVLVVVESAYLQGCRPLAALRQEVFGEKSKVLVMGGDTAYFKELCEWPSCAPADMPDLFIDLLDGAAVGFGRRYNASVNAWMWTPSATLVKLLHGFSHLTQNITRNTSHVVAFMRVEGLPIRVSMKQAVQAANYTLHHGIGNNVGTLPDTFMLYRQSVAAIGSTSASWPQHPCRTMKGFRDWIAPHLGAVVVYDDHPDVIRKYPAMPLYKDGNWTDLIEVLRRPEVSDLTSPARAHLLERQQQWVVSNLLDRQLIYYVRHVLLRDAADAGGVSAVPADEHVPGWVLPADVSNLPLDGCVQPAPTPAT